MKITLDDLAFAIETIIQSEELEFDRLEDFLDYCNENSDAYVVIENPAKSIETFKIPTKNGYSG